MSTLALIADRSEMGGGDFLTTLGIGAFIVVAYTRSPQGQEPREQRCGEPRNALCELPPEAALEGGPREADARESVGESCACKRRLSPEFVSWMMGLPEGWVTGRGLSRPEQLKCLGNGVVPQQAAAATAAWVADTRSERAA